MVQKGMRPEMFKFIKFIFLLLFIAHVIYSNENADSNEIDSLINNYDDIEYSCGLNDLTGNFLNCNHNFSIILSRTWGL